MASKWRTHKAGRWTASGLLSVVLLAPSACLLEAPPPTGKGSGGNGGGGQGGEGGQGAAGGEGGGAGGTGGSGGGGGGGAGGGGVKPDAGAADAGPWAATSKEMACLAAHNAKRAEVGAKPLVMDNELVCAARKHSEDMAKRGFFDHINPEGESPTKRCSKCGDSCDGENISAGRSTCEGAVEDWMTSPGHKMNILKTTYKRLGCGYAMGGTYGHLWTCVFSSK